MAILRVYIPLRKSMKGFIAIGLMLVFASQLVKPYIPYIDYYINQDYIAENLCENKEKPALKCHGQCHLKKEVKKAAEKEDETPVAPSNQSKKENQSVQHFCQNNTTLVFNPEHISYSFDYLETTSDFVLKIIIPPPKSA